jgi:hypothetical protein
MSLLQHPLKALDQMEWYLDSRNKELFPGAFLLAAGNLARQILEQVVFIVAFYSGMPRRKYLKTSNQLRPLDSVIKVLSESDPASGRSYLQLAASKGSRIRRLTRLSRSFDRWRRLFNEPSHFANPAAGRRTRELHMRGFAKRLRRVLHDTDGHLITAAVNEIRSNGFIKAVLGKEPDNVPGVEYTVVVTPDMIHYKDGKFSMLWPEVSMQVVPNTKEVPYRWRKRIMVVENSVGIALLLRGVTRTGQPINISTFQSIIDSFVNDPSTARN